MTPAATVQQQDREIQKLKSEIGKLKKKALKDSCITMDNLVAVRNEWQIDDQLRTKDRSLHAVSCFSIVGSFSFARITNYARNPWTVVHGLPLCTHSSSLEGAMKLHHVLFCRNQNFQFLV